MRLRKSSTDFIFAGVCGGIADFFGISSSIVRLIFFLTGALGLYILLAIFLDY